MTRSVVMLLTNDFVSDPRVEKEATALAEDGWAVTVLAWDRSQSHPAAEDRGPFRIERLGPAAPYGGGPRNITRFREFWRRATERAIELSPDVVHCHDLDTAPAGLAVLRRSATPRPKLVLDFHELYRESKMVPQTGITGAAAGVFVRSVERRAIAAADLVVVANPGSISAYSAHDMAGKTVLVENAPDLERFIPQPSHRAAENPLRVSFVGQKRYTRGLHTLMEAVQRDARFSALLAGGGVAEDEIARAATRFARVTTEGRVNYADIPRYYADADVVYAVYDAALGNVRTLFPVKVMEGMASAVPVIVSKGTWIAEYVLEHEIGLAVDEGDVDDVASALRLLADDPAVCKRMGERGRAVVESELNWKAAAGRLVSAYRNL